MKRFLLAGVAALALTGCSTVDGGDAPVPGTALYHVAERLAAKGDAATAAALFRSAIAMGNAAPEVRRGYGNALLAIGQPRAAAEQFEVALKQKKDPRLYNGLGVAYDMLGEHDRAQATFREGLALAPNNHGLIHNYGLSLASAAPRDDTAANPGPAPASHEEPQAAPTSERRIAPTAAAAPEPTAAPKPVPVAMHAPATGPTPTPAPVATRTSAFVPAPVFTPVAMHAPAALPEKPVTLIATRAPQPAPFSPADDEPIAPKPNEIVPLDRPIATTPLNGEYFRVRLAGTLTRARAVEVRREIEQRAPELQNAMRVVAQRASLALAAPLRYELVTAPLLTRRAAEEACDALAARGLVCRTEPADSPLILRS